MIVVSHDRYFMDKVVDHLLVFRGNADIKDFPGNYTQYREWKEVQDQLEKETEAACLAKTVPAVEKTPRPGSLSNDELLAKSERIAKVIEEIDEKTMRWLELSELA